MSYPRDWNALRKAVRIRDERCMNCRRSPAATEGLPFDTHHVVPLGWGGSNRMSNLILLCRDCHEAAHGRSMVPVIKFYSNGSMTFDEFEMYRRYWDAHELARFNGDERYWYIPRADAKYLTSSAGVEPRNFHLPRNVSTAVRRVLYILRGDFREVVETPPRSLSVSTVH